MYDDDPTSSIGQVEQYMLELVFQGAGQAGQAATDHLAAGGSRIRARLALHAAHALGLPRRETIAIAAACELLHNASLVHDDLQDRDALRRGQEAVWRRHGDAIAICTGDLLLSAAYGALADTGVAAAALITRMHRRVGAVIRGQCDDVALQSGTLQSLAVYEQVASGKSAPLLILPLELTLALAGRDNSIAVAEEAGSLFAVGYQAADDLDDVTQDALNEELNIVAVLAAAGERHPHRAARNFAIKRFRQAHAVSLTLPAGCGGLLAQQASRRADALSDVLETT
jgi:geranylgeranyl diphosphate synthase, type I